MTDTPKRTLSALEMTSTPRLPRSVRLRHDRERDRWVLLAPERVFSPDPIAVEVIRLCDGKRDIGMIADELAGRYTARPDRIAADILELIAELGEKGVVSW